MPKKKSNEPRNRRLQGVPLSAEQLRELVKIWKEHSDGERGFAALMAEVEYPRAEEQAKNTENILRNLRRVEEKEQLISPQRFKIVADVLKTTAEDLKNRISSKTAISVFDESVPWVTDDNVLAEYRTVFHHYHHTKQGDDLFWIYTPINFSTARKGYLCDADYTIPDSKGKRIKYPIYGYVFRQMLILILTSDKAGCLKEHVRVYHDFRKGLRDSYGHFGIHLNEDWNTDAGVGGCLLFIDPFPGTDFRGRQKPAICEALDEHWRMLDGKLCNRLLYLLGRKPYSRPFVSISKSENPAGIKKPRKKDGGRKHR